ncbi:MAG TPA: HEAT repeat domain-containing protein [Thermomicrobiales bacterium]|nr:HEAT repeat domain-containing protein [Thermomicrobiales bacterium]
MSTPMFPETPRRENGPSFDQALAHIQANDFTERDVEALSDLTKQDAATLAASWSDLPAEGKVRLVRLMDDLAEAQVNLLFGRALRVALTDESPVVRQLAVDALWEDEGPDLCRVLLRVLREDASTDVRAAAGMGLARYATAGACEELDDALTEELRAALTAVVADQREPYLVRRRALESVAVFGQDPNIRALISDAYNADDAGMQAAALYAMGRSLDQRWVELLVSELRSEDAEMRFEAARALGEIGDRDTVPEIANVTTDEDTEVRQAAIMALGRIGGKAAVRVLHALEEDASAADRDAIADALDEAQDETLP